MFGGSYVFHVKDAIISKFKLNAAPHQMDLFKLEGSTHTPLEPMQTLDEAGLLNSGVVKLVVALKIADTHAPTAGALLVSCGN